jgi:hypothetical protein
VAGALAAGVAVLVAGAADLGGGVCANVTAPVASNTIKAFIRPDYKQSTGADASGAAFDPSRGCPHVPEWSLHIYC